MLRTCHSLQKCAHLSVYASWLSDLGQFTAGLPAQSLHWFKWGLLTSAPRAVLRLGRGHLRESQWQMLRKRPAFASLTSPHSRFPGHSHKLLHAFSSEHLMGFTLVSDTCWKCNCAHNCYLEREAASPLPRPSTGAPLRKRCAHLKPSLYPCCWSCVGALPLDAGHLAREEARQEGNTWEAFRFPEPTIWHWVQGSFVALS